MVRTRRPPCPPSTTSRLVFALVAGAFALTSCGDDEDVPEYPERYTIAVMMPVGERGGLPDLDHAVSKINALGGVHEATPLQLEYHDISELDEDARVALAEQLIEDAEVQAVIGPGSVETFINIAPSFIEGDKPLVSFTDTSGELLRAFGGTNALWRTKSTDLVQAEFIARELKREGAARIGLLTPVDDQSATFFNWFSFYAQDEGFAADQLMIETLIDSSDANACEAAVAALFDAELDAIVVAPPPDAFECITEAIGALRPDAEELPTRVIYADLGAEHQVALSELGAAAVGIEGWSAGQPAEVEAFEREWLEFHPEKEASYPANAAPAHDAMLLIAYGLETAAATGLALPDAIERAALGEGDPYGMRSDEIKGALAAIRAGETPNVNGATGPLSYDPELLLDLTSGVLARWRFERADLGEHGPSTMYTFAYDKQTVFGEGGEPPRFAAKPRADSYEEPEGPAEDVYTPASPSPSASKALIITASSGWDNYRHQADALARYQLLRAAGLSDEDIVMVGADDIANDPSNALAGVVRNEPGGEDVYAGVTYDYSLASFSPDQITPVLLGESSAETPQVLALDADTNLYVYIAGHGGLTGVGFGASSLEQGLGGAGVEFLDPATLRETLCTLRELDGVRRVFIELEACYAGVYGDADFGGIEFGCDDGATPLTGVMMLTAAGTLENSLGSGWDPELQSWVSDEFSYAMLSRLREGDDPSLIDLYQGVYLGVTGSHVGAYNTATYGDLRQLSAAEYRLTQ